jgi:hypothetical protein
LLCILRTQINCVGHRRRRNYPAGHELAGSHRPPTGEIGKALKFLTKVTDQRAYKEWEKLEQSRLSEEALLGCRHEGRLEAGSKILSALAALDNSSMMKAAKAALDELKITTGAAARRRVDHNEDHNENWLAQHSIDLRGPGRKWIPPVVQPPAFISETQWDNMSAESEAKFLDDVSVRTKKLLAQHPSW